MAHGKFKVGGKRGDTATPGQGIADKGNS